jgi:hypothetical protein
VYALQVLRRCLEATREDGGGHAMCRMALAFRLYKGLGTRVDWGEAALHYKHAAQLAVRCTVTPRVGEKGGGGARHGTRAARVGGVV